MIKLFKISFLILNVLIFSVMGFKTNPSLAASLTAKWNLYHNKKLGFALKYPQDWQPVEVEEEGLSLSAGQLPSALRVCFADLAQKDLRCKAELYVTSQMDDFKNPEATSFLGFSRLQTQKAPDTPRTQDRIETTRVDLTSPTGAYLSCVFFKKDPWVYLFVMPDFHVNDLDYPIFRSLVSSLVFPKSDDQRKNSPKISQDFKDFFEMPLKELENVQVKLTYLGPQQESIPSILLAASAEILDMEKFSSFQRSGLSYANDHLNPQSLLVAPEKLKALISNLSSTPEIVGERVIDLPYVSVSFLKSDSTEDKFFEAILDQLTASKLFVLLRRALPADQEARNLLQSWGCGLGLLPAAPASEVTNKVKITRSGIRLNPDTGYFEQTVTLKNTSYEPLPGPISLVVNFKRSLRLHNADGTTCLVTPAGREFIDIPLPSGRYGSFFPDEELEVTLQFEAGQGDPIDYSTQVVSASGER